MSCFLTRPMLMGACAAHLICAVLVVSRCEGQSRQPASDRQSDAFAGLLSGDVKIRIAALHDIEHAANALDDKTLDGLANCLGHEDLQVRTAATRVLRRHCYTSDPEKIKRESVIRALVLMAADPSTDKDMLVDLLRCVEPKDDRVFKALIKFGVETDDPQILGPVAGGLRDAGPEKLDGLLRPYLDNCATDPDRAMLAYMLFLKAFQHPPDNTENVSVSFYVAFLPKDASKFQNADVMLRQFLADFGALRVRKVVACRGTKQSELMGLAQVEGLDRGPALESALSKSSEWQNYDHNGPLLAISAMEARLERAGIVARMDGNGQAISSPDSYPQAFEDLFRVLGDKYPNFALKEIDWQAVGKELLPRSKLVKSEREFGLLCMELIARLKDSHAALLPAAAEPPKPSIPHWTPGFACLVDDKGELAVFHVADKSPAEQAGLKVGMVLVSINGTSAKDVQTAHMSLFRKYYGHSSMRLLEREAARLIACQPTRNVAMIVVVRDQDGRMKECRMLPSLTDDGYIPRMPVPIKGIEDGKDVSWTMLGKDVGYIRVRRIRETLAASLDKSIKEMTGAKVLLIDVRGNTGGGFDSASAFRNFDVSDSSEPDRPRFAGPIALLIDEGCISAGEGWASWFVAKKRAILVGAATAGASCAKEEYLLTNGMYKVRIPIRPYDGFLDRPIERRGLEPDLPVKMKASDLAVGRDTVLEAASASLLKRTQATQP